MNRYGYAGSILRVDLSAGGIGREQTDEAMTDGYLGGTGFGAWYLHRENRKSVHWASPENRLIIANGPLSNTPFHGSGTLSFASKGPSRMSACSMLPWQEASLPQ